MYGYYIPPREDMIKCTFRGESCDYGICDECILHKKEIEERETLVEEIPYIKGKNYFNKEL